MYSGGSGCWVGDGDGVDGGYGGWSGDGSGVGGVDGFYKGDSIHCCRCGLRGWSFCAITDQAGAGFNDAWTITKASDPCVEAR